MGCGRCWARLGHRRPRNFESARHGAHCSSLDGRRRIPHAGGAALAWRSAHVVHYPVKTGALINIVAIVDDRWSEPGWTASGDRDELLEHYSPGAGARGPISWLCRIAGSNGAYDLDPISRWSEGPVTLLGDAAHPMLHSSPRAPRWRSKTPRCWPTAWPLSQRHPSHAPYERRGGTHREGAEGRPQQRTDLPHECGRSRLAKSVSTLAGGSLMLQRYNWLYDWRITRRQRRTSERAA